MEDPVGNAGKGVQTVKEKMRQAGLENITLHLLPGARHDVLHEEASGSAAKARTIISDWMALEAAE
jgi:alpha-beta hydrolase superfamily lysophospholipase